MNVILGCEESQALCIEYRKLGHNAYSCDLQPCSGGHPEWHFQMDIMTVIKGGKLITQDGTVVFIEKWDQGIFFPTCTYLTLTANKWFKDQPKRKSGALVGKERRDARDKALQFVCDLMNCDIEQTAIENPVGVIGSRIFDVTELFGPKKWKVFNLENNKSGRSPDQIIQPFHFGHPEPKQTCLWLKGLPRLRPTNIVEPKYHITKSGKRMPEWYAYADKSKGQEHRAKIRSKTFSGIAKAMAEQWGGKIN